jgi:hypothetical protein
MDRLHLFCPKLRSLFHFWEERKMSLDPDDRSQNPLAWQAIELYERQLHDLNVISNYLQRINEFVRTLRPRRRRGLTMTSIMNIAQRETNTFAIYFAVDSFTTQWITNNVGFLDEEERRRAELHARNLALSVTDFFSTVIFN